MDQGINWSKHVRIALLLDKNNKIIPNKSKSVHWYNLIIFYTYSTLISATHIHCHLVRKVLMQHVSISHWSMLKTESNNFLMITSLASFTNWQWHPSSWTGPRTESCSQKCISKSPTQQLIVKPILKCLILVYFTYIPLHVSAEIIIKWFMNTILSWLHYLLKWIHSLHSPFTLLI
jgi:hypothetical protein